MSMDGDLFETLRLELRRGSLTLGVLAQLREERYGYTLRQALAADGLEMEESTLYPLLRRLEAQGLLVSEWREEDRRRKRFYRLSPEGRAMLARLLAEWRRLGASLDKIIEPSTRTDTP
jgi:DNA-binding PadR family transcriptional regulator